MSLLEKFDLIKYFYSFWCNFFNNFKKLRELFGKSYMNLEKITFFKSNVVSFNNTVFEKLISECK